MKFTSSSDNLFKPITISFTIEIKLLIESEEEFNSLLYLTSLDESIPELFNTKQQQQIIVEFLQSLRTELYYK